MLILYTLIVIAASCSSSRQPTSSIAEIKQDNHYIVFAVFKIVDDPIHQKRRIELVRKIKAPGKLKVNSDPPHPFENYLDIEFYKNSLLVTSMRIEHPLYKRIEYTRDDNSLTSVMTSLAEAEFFLRVQLMQASDYTIRITETLGKKKPVLITNIPFTTQLL